MFPVAVARHNFRMGVPQTNSWPYGRVLKPEELWNLDTKIDDGRPALSAITSTLSSYGFTPDCVTSDAVDANYELTFSSNECIFIGAAGI